MINLEPELYCHIALISYFLAFNNLFQIAIFRVRNYVGWVDICPTYYNGNDQASSSSRSKSESRSSDRKWEKGKNPKSEDGECTKSYYWIPEKGDGECTLIGSPKKVLHLMVMILTSPKQRPPRWRAMAKADAKKAEAAAKKAALEEQK